MAEDNTSKRIEQVRVVNSLGLHTRPAAMIVKMLHNSKCNIFFTHQRETINAKSILSILMLAAKKNSLITITVEGDGADKTMDTLVQGFADGFGESDD